MTEQIFDFEKEPDWSKYDNYEFIDGEIFTEEYPPQLVDWVDAHDNEKEHHAIKEIEPDSEGKRRFEYVVEPYSSDELNELKLKDLKCELQKLDFATIRCLRAQVAGTASVEDVTKLTETEKKVKELREQIKKLESKNEIN